MRFRFRSWSPRLLFYPFAFLAVRFGFGEKNTRFTPPRPTSKNPRGDSAIFSQVFNQNFRLRANPELAQKHGLLPGMAVYKFFRVGIKKPVQYSRVFINDEPLYRYQAEHELAPYFELDKQKRLRVKKSCRKQAKEPLIKNSTSPIDFIKLCLATASRAVVKNNPAWNPWSNRSQTQIHGPLLRTSGQKIRGLLSP